ncbi:hypothetical protein KAW80_03090 [Candidatus Babeliales bacterium]|nr:hypothetical protein [Candidatus Babeliales bacterium]
MRFRQAIFIILLFLFSSSRADTVANYNVRHKVYNQLELLHKNVMGILDQLYAYIYYYNECKGSRFSRVGKWGQVIDKYCLGKDPEEAFFRLEVHKDECLNLINELALLLQELNIHLNNIRQKSEKAFKRDLKLAVVFLGESISQVGDITCPVCRNVKEQLNVYDVMLKKLRFRFKQNRLKRHIPTFVELYREKFLVAICVTTLLSAGIVATGNTRVVGEKLYEGGMLPFKIMKESYDSFLKLVGWKQKEDRSDHFNRIERVARKILEHIPGLKENITSNDDHETLRNKVHDWEEKYLDSENGTLKKINDDSKAAKKNLNEKQVSIWRVDGLLEAGIHFVSTFFEQGQTSLLLFQVLVADFLLLLVSLDPMIQTLDNLGILLASLVPPVVAGFGVNKILGKLKQNVYNIIDDCFLHIDQILSRYADQKPITKLDEGLLIFWLEKLQKEANADAVSRDDRMRITFIIEQIKDFDLPVSQKLRAIDIQWRFRKAMPSFA